MSGLTHQLVADFSGKDTVFGGVSLEVTMSQLFSVANLGQFLAPEQVTHLNFAVNFLHEIEAVFQSCQGLRLLDLSINHIERVQNLDYCRNLVELNLSKNNIAFVQGLEQLGELRVLNLSMNQILRIEGLENLRKLVVLHIYGNQIEMLEGLEGIESLKELFINRNRLRSLNYLGLIKLKSLVKLNASYNLISEDELDNVAHVTLTLSNLKELDLYGNEVFNNPAYKFRLTENSNLEKLDGLNVKGIIKERLDNLRREWQVNQVIAETQEESQKWIEAERELKSHALNMIAKKQQRIADDFHNFQEDVNKDLSNFVTYIQDLKHQRMRGESDQITDGKLREWKRNVGFQEHERMMILDQQLRALEDKRREQVNDTVTSTNFIDKLYEISMHKPESWVDMKGLEHVNAQAEDNSYFQQRQSQRQIPPPSQASRSSINSRGSGKKSGARDLVKKSTQKAIGQKMRQEVNEEVDQAKVDFEDQKQAEFNAERRHHHQSQIIGGGQSNQLLGSVKVQTPQRNVRVPSPNVESRASQRNDNSLRQSTNSLRSRSRSNSKGKQPIPIGSPNQQSPNQQSPNVSQRVPSKVPPRRPPQSDNYQPSAQSRNSQKMPQKMEKPKKSRACLIF